MATGSLPQQREAPATQKDGVVRPSAGHADPPARYFQTFRLAEEDRYEEELLHAEWTAARIVSKAHSR
jgi:hypothetical protein